ncbi:hypothetical protein GCM10025858_38320 [Alicyclobacillus sacchari]|nr:hypothetical protein GCM10025858_38320 [Alicyclobacillus sacchari]
MYCNGIYHIPWIGRTLLSKRPQRLPRGYNDFGPACENGRCEAKYEQTDQAGRDGEPSGVLFEF